MTSLYPRVLIVRVDEATYQRIKARRSASEPMAAFLRWLLERGLQT